MDGQGGIYGVFKQRGGDRMTMAEGGNVSWFVI